MSFAFLTLGSAFRVLALLVLTAGLCVPCSTQAFSQEVPAPRILAGYDPERVTGSVLRLRPGIAADAGGTRFLRSLTALEIDITKVGPNGLDRGSPADGEDYFVYLISEEATARVAGLSRKATDLAGNCRSDSCTTPGGAEFQPSTPHIGRVDRKIELTEAEDSAVWAVTIGFASEVWADVDFSAHVPDNARVVTARFEISHQGSDVGSAFVRSVGLQAIGRRVGSSIAGGAPRVETFSIRITIDRKLQARATQGAKLNIFVVGYDMTEPS